LYFASAKNSLQWDIWALAMTIWEIFSGGTPPPKYHKTHTIKMVYLLQIKISLHYFFYANRIILLETLIMMIKLSILQYLKCGIRLPPPKDCPNEIYKLMLECWGKNNSIARKKPQAIMRDINQISIYNARRTHTYATICPKFFRDADENNDENGSIYREENQIVNRKRVWSLITLILLRMIIVSRFKSS